MHFAFRTFILVGFTCLLSCKPAYYIVKQSPGILTISDTSKHNNPIDAYLKPFRDSLSTKMDVAVTFAEGPFVKERPGGSLGNLFCDGILSVARQSDSTVMMAISNFGGLRINRWSEGPILVRNVFELMPFDNTLVILDVPGTVLEQWIKHMANMGGWPIAGTLVNVDTNKQLIQLQSLITNEVQPIDPQKNYRIATSDYIANGGDRCDFLISIKQSGSGLLLRDALMQYLQGKKRIQPNTQKRFKLY